MFVACWTRVMQCDSDGTARWRTALPQHNMSGVIAGAEFRISRIVFVSLRPYAEVSSREFMSLE